MAPEPYSSGEIDITLALAGQNEIATLVSTLTDLGNSINVLKAFDPNQHLAAQQNLVSGFQAQGTAASVPTAWAAQAADLGQREGMSATGSHSAETTDEVLDAEEKAVRRALRDISEDETAEIRPGRQGSQSDFASHPDHAMENAMVAGMLQMPGAGEGAGMQDFMNAASLPLKLGFASKLAGGVARKRHVSAAEQAGYTTEEIDAGLADDVTAGTGMMRASNILGSAAQYSPYIAYGLGYFGAQQGSGPGVMGLQMNPTDIIAEQERRGYSGAGGTLQDLPLVGSAFEDLGINRDLPGIARLFMTEAGGAALREQVERLKQRAKNAGLSTREQEIIEDALTTSGRMGPRQTGDIRSAIYRTLGDRQQGYGGLLNSADPRMVTDAFLRATQMGVESLSGFEESMRGIPTAANAARVGIDEMIDQATAMGEYFQEIGGRFTQGFEFAQDWSRTTGLAAPIGQQVLSNPMVQGIIAGQTGLLPNQLGALPSGTLTGGVYSAMELMMDTFRGFTPDARVRIPGAGMVRVDGRQGDMAVAAQQLGMTPEAFERMWANRGRTKALTNLDLAMDAWDASRDRPMYGVNPNDNRVTGEEIGKIMQRAGIGREQRLEVKHLMSTDPQAARRRVNQLIEKKTVRDRRNLEKDSEQRVRLELTGEAKNWLREVRQGRNARRENAEAARRGERVGNAIFAGPGAPASARERMFNDVTDLGFDDDNSFFEDVVGLGQDLGGGVLDGANRGESPIDSLSRTLADKIHDPFD